MLWLCINLFGYHTLDWDWSKLKDTCPSEKLMTPTMGIIWIQITLNAVLYISLSLYFSLSLYRYICISVMYTGKDELINCRSQEWQKMYKKHARWNAYFSFDRRSLNFLTSKKLYFLGIRVNLASVFKFARCKNSARTSKLKQVVVN